MADRDFVLDTFLDKTVKAAKVNLCTGEYVFVKIPDTPEEQESMTADTIDGYFANLIERGQIYAGDIVDCRYQMDLTFVRERIFGRKEKVAATLRCKEGEDYVWTMLEIIAPEDVSEEKPWVVYCWRKSNQDACIMKDGLKQLMDMYEMVLKIDLTTDGYMELAKDGSSQEGGEPVKAKSSKKSKVKQAKISRLFRKYARSGDIHKEDVKQFLELAKLDMLRETFSDGKKSVRFRYRCKVGEIFHWFMMEFVRSVEYTEKNQMVMLYVKDIHEEYVIKTEHQRKLVYFANFDKLTSVWNHEYFYQKCQEYRQGGRRYPAAIMYTNMNGMRERNKTQGFEEGNRYIRSFAELLVGEFGKNSVYRLNGDGFVVLFEGDNERAVRLQVSNLRNILKQQEEPMAAVGYAWSGAPENLEDLLSEAEDRMLVDKNLYYEKAKLEKQKDNTVHAEECDSEDD